MFPKAVTGWLSVDGTTWREVRQPAADGAPNEVGTARRRLGAHLLQPVEARWVRLVVKSSGPLPAGHAGAGEPSWIFADEIVVE